MSGQFLIDWLALAVSLFNTILLTWLGLTVLFNAERRTWGVIIAVGGLLAGAIFFISHSVILSLGATSLIQRFGFWWQVGWFPVVAAPLAWYLLMLWYTGFWDDAASPLRRRQTPWLGLTFVYTLAVGVLLLVGNPLPLVSRGAYIEVTRLPAIGPVPWIILIYPPYILLCVGLALDALLRPAPSGRAMGDLARGRARPWLVGASGVLLLVSLMVGGIFLWLIQEARRLPLVADMLFTYSTTLSLLDLALAALLTTAILLLSRAVVSYEIFTGKTLPRRGFLRQWSSTMILAAALSGLAALGVIWRAPQVVTVLVLLCLAAFSFALFGWQSFQRREADIRQLRPIVSSPRLLERMLTPLTQERSEVDLAEPFEAFCKDVLGAESATLAPLGPLAALGVSSLVYPRQGLAAPAAGAISAPPISELAGYFTTPQTVGMPLPPGRADGAIWVVPLWSERGLTGLLLLGPKNDGGFYSLEEIEIARAGGERLADIQASAEMARRLVALQRQRLSESGVLDQRTRRVLHDDVLPRLHTTLLQLSAAKTEPMESQEVIEQLTAAHRQISNLLHELPAPRDPRVSALGVMGALRKVLSEELPNSFDEVTWEVEPDAESLARQLPPLTAEVVFFAAREALRNAARHARQPGSNQPLRLRISASCPSEEAGPEGLAYPKGLVCSKELAIRIEDDGVGIPRRDGMQPGQRVEEQGGNDSPKPAGQGLAGQGLALHSTLMALVSGSLSLESAPGEYTRVVLSVPGTASEYPM